MSGTKINRLGLPYYNMFYSRRNGGLIGPRNTPTNTSASGIFYPNDQFNQVRLNRWPREYTVTANVSRQNENTTVTFTIRSTTQATGTLYWVNIGTTTAADFTGGANSGSFSLTANTGTVTLTLTDDQLTEGTETIQLEIRSGSTTGTLLTVSEVVQILDTSINAGYTLSSSVNIINEGSTVVFYIGAALPNGTVLYWTNSGTTTAADFVGGTTSGSVTLTNNAATVSLTLVNDIQLEGTETIVFQLRTGSTVGTIVGTTTVQVADTSVPNYAVSPSASTITEGGSVTFTITTQGVSDGTTVYWTIAGTVDAADISGGAVSGSTTINSNTASVTITTTAGNDYEGSENLTFQVRTGSISGLVAASSVVSVVDAAPTYSVSPSAASFAEGETVTWTVTCTNVQSGTVLYWTNSGTATSDDFTGGAVSGSFTVTNNVGTVALTAALNAAYEGAETVVIQIRTLSTLGTVVATSSSVTLNDATPTATVTPSKTTVTEWEDAVTFSVTTTNCADGTVLYWTNAGTSTGSDLQGGSNSGSFSITGNQGSFVITTQNDGSSEGSETLIVQVRTVSTSGNVIGTAATVTITDNSTGSLSVEYVVVAGGGGGGGAGYYTTTTGKGAGGGGGGGVRTQSTISLSGGQDLAVVVGAGGAGGTQAVLTPSTDPTSGSKGGDSSFNGMVSTGGGFGARAGPSGGVGGGNGGSGGGGDGEYTSRSISSPSTTPVQGYGGGRGSAAPYYVGGAGGGAGSGREIDVLICDWDNNYNGVGIRAGTGGAGVTVWGTAYGDGGDGGGNGDYAGGAGKSILGRVNSGGGDGGANSPGLAGTTNQGGGGGAAGSRYLYGGNTSNGGNGGSGVVVIRYSGSPRAFGGTITESGGYTYHTFTTSGTFRT